MRCREKLPKDRPDRPVFVLQSACEASARRCSQSLSLTVAALRTGAGATRELSLGNWENRPQASLGNWEHREIGVQVLPDKARARASRPWVR